MVEERHAEHALFFFVVPSIVPARSGRKLLFASSPLGKPRQEILNWAVVVAHVFLLNCEKWGQTTLSHTSPPQCTRTACLLKTLSNYCAETFPEPPSPRDAQQPRQLLDWRP